MELKHPSTKQEWEHREQEAVTERGAHSPMLLSQLLASKVCFSWKCDIFLKRKVDSVRSPEIEKKKKKRITHKGGSSLHLLCNLP